MRELKEFLSIGLVGLIAIAVSGCASSNPPPTAPPPVALDPPAASAPFNPVEVGQDLKTSPLDQLWESRRSNATDFPIGVGDVIEVSVPGMQEFQAQGSGAAAGGPEASGQQSQGNNTVRVDGLGDIDLPLLGHIHVAGLTEGQLKDELTHRLDKYMYDPQVELFVKSYMSREVAVTGEVHSPGMYIVNGPTETIHDLVIRAGGTTDNAAPKIMLTPANTAGKTQLTAASAWTPHSAVQGIGSGVNDAASLEASVQDSPHSTYMIDLTNRQTTERYLNIPVRPGDTVYVPRAGSVTVIGWVYSPKTVDITPGLTVLSVVSAAGGTLFAADATKIKVIRQKPGRETSTLVVNLNDIKEARAPDVLVQANDVIEVPYKASRIPGYALYYAAQGIVTMGPMALIYGGL
ncbi:MAG: polysaccharide biosynthesis/export family protein [Candidatus Binataceae bacterium]